MIKLNLAEQMKKGSVRVRREVPKGTEHIAGHPEGLPVALLGAFARSGSLKI